VCLPLVIPNSGTAKSAKKERAEMAVISKDIVSVGFKVVVGRKPMGSVIGANGFALSTEKKIGRLSFDKIYVKYIGKGLFRVSIEMASPKKGVCLAKVSGNWESKSLWANVDAGLVALGLNRKTKPIIASGMYVGSYKKGSKTVSGRGNGSSSETIVVLE
jgi:hypothetical protein